MFQIIESREIGDSGHEIVQISNLNLVDLAGSERADQTGATGSRLKEGGFINKSLLSLSLVIQNLSENLTKYINYRDSKLTRILQASLGGNAMTAIICTVTPAVVEETYSTLHFAMRAKTIKNKPKVNEEVTDAAMMKKLQKEITMLKNKLAEKTKNRETNLSQLERFIMERETQFVVSHNHLASDKTRRRTWCPTTDSNVAVLKKLSHDGNFLLPRIPEIPPLDTKFLTFERDSDFNCVSPTMEFDKFIPGEEFSMDVDCCSPTPSPLSIDKWTKEIKTPKLFKNYTNHVNNDDSLTEEDWKAKYLKVESELNELRDFTRLEYKMHQEESKFNQKTNCLEKELHTLKDSLVNKDLKLGIFQSR